MADLCRWCNSNARYGADDDAAILAAAERGEIAPAPSQPALGDDCRRKNANAVHDAAQGDRGWYIGASVREGATFRQQEPPLKAQMRTRADVESSPAFRQWFGESKVVGEDGKPMAVYHGTFGDFDTFEQTKDIGYHFGTAKAARDRLRGLGKKMASGTRLPLGPRLLARITFRFRIRLKSVTRRAIAGNSCLPT